MLAPHGLRAMFSDQLDRPLQVESLGAAVLMAAEHLGMRPLATIDSHGAQALSGHGAGLAADLSTVLEVIAAVLAVWIVLRAASQRGRRGDPASRRRRCSLRVVAFDKVLSPQYLIWLVPFVVLVRGVRGIVAGGLLLARARPDADVVPLALLVARARPRRAVVVVPARPRPRARRARGVLVLELSRARDSEGGRAGSPAARRAAA